MTFFIFGMASEATSLATPAGARAQSATAELPGRLAEKSVAFNAGRTWTVWLTRW
jgi:hypothetical protein